jgi:TRAP-type C4-dicarboxylate transport system substrate-binding protein
MLETQFSEPTRRTRVSNTCRPGLLIVSALILSACGTSGPAAETPASGVEPKLVFRLANELIPSGKIWDVSRLFIEEIERASPDGQIQAGEIDVMFFDQGMVGTERQLLENVYFGVMEVVQLNPSVVSTIEPTYNLFDLPYIFVSDQHHKAVLNGEIGDLFLERLRSHDMLGLGFYGLGFRNMFYREPGGGCVQTPEDLRGLKMRVVESPIMINGINAMGASATPVPFSELFQSLRTGVVDGADNSAAIYTATRFYETGANCFTLTEHFTNQHMLVANAAWFDSLEPKYQARIHEVARSIVPDMTALWEEGEQAAYAEMATLGVKVNRIEDKAPFMARTESVAEQFLRDNPQVPRELYDRIRAAGEAE